MSRLPDNLRNRREFFKFCGRSGVLGIFAALGASLFKIRNRGEPGKHRCVNRSVCCNCPVFRDCALPAAMSAKNAKERIVPVADSLRHVFEKESIQ